MRVLVDTDVLLDVALGRQPWAQASGEFLDACQRGEHSCFVAWHSISNLYYYIAKGGSAKAKAFIRDLLRFVQVASVGTDDMAYALDMDLADFEDAMQVAAAVACRASRIVTRNTKHYAKSIVPAITPAQFLASTTE